MRTPFDQRIGQQHVGFRSCDHPFDQGAVGGVAVQVNAEPLPFQKRLARPHQLAGLLPHVLPPGKVGYRHAGGFGLGEQARAAPVHLPV